MFEKMLNQVQHDEFWLVKDSITPAFEPEFILNECCYFKDGLRVKLHYYPE